jgi:hypothetical protein
MNEDTDTFYLRMEAQGLFAVHPTLYLIDLPSDAMLQRFQLIPAENQLAVFARGYSDTLRVGTQFDVLFPQKHPDDLVYCAVTLAYVSVNPGYEIDHLPHGYSGICFLEFEGDLPKALLKKLAAYDCLKDPKVHDLLVLTQRAAVEIEKS